MRYAVVLVLVNDRRSWDLMSFLFKKFESAFFLVLKQVYQVIRKIHNHCSVLKKKPIWKKIWEKQIYPTIFWIPVQLILPFEPREKTDLCVYGLIVCMNVCVCVLLSVLSYSNMFLTPHDQPYM